MSFVIWLDINTRDNEIKVITGESKINKSVSFTMYYTNSIGDIETKDILLDGIYNNKMILIMYLMINILCPIFEEIKLEFRKNRCGF